MEQSPAQRELSGAPAFGAHIIESSPYDPGAVVMRT